MIEKDADTVVASEDNFVVLLNCWRGMIVGSYAQVESLVSELLIRCSALPEYENLVPKKFPYPLDKRINVVKALLLVEDGPLFKYSEEARALVTRLADFEPLRHAMVHSMVTTYYNEADPEKSRIVFRRYDFVEKGELVRFDLKLFWDELGMQQMKITTYATKAIEVLCAMLQERELSRPIAAIRAVNSPG